MAQDPAPPLSDLRAFVADLIKKNALLTPKLASPLIRDRFGKGVWFPTLAQWFQELKPGYVAKKAKWRKAAKAAKRPAKKAAPKAAARKAKRAAQAAPVVAAPRRGPGGRPRGSARRPGAAKPPARAASPATRDRYLVEMGGKSNVVAGLDAALAGINRFLGSGGAIGEVRISKIVPVRLGVQVVEA